MSRLYGKSSDVYSFSRYLIDLKIPNYKKDTIKTKWEDVEECPQSIEMYLPESAIKIIENNPIRLIGSPLAVKSAYLLPSNKDEEPIMVFPKKNPIEEYKRELVFFIGEMLSSITKDNEPDENEIPSEYSSVIGFLLEYLYLKENGKEDTFSIKHINELLCNSKKYVKLYKNFQNIQLSDKNKYLFLDDYEDSKERIKFDSLEKQFLDVTLENLVPISSLDAALQLKDMDLDKDSIKELLNDLILNQDHNRQLIINNIGIKSYGFKRLRKEIDMRRR